MKSMDDLILAYLNDQADAADVERLFAWIHADPENAKEFARAAALHAHLRAQLSGEEQVRTSDPPQPAPRKPSPCDAKDMSLPLHVYCFFARPTPLSMSVAALVVGLIITTMAFMAPPFYRALTEREPQEENNRYSVVAEVTATRNVKWTDDATSLRRGAFLVGGTTIDLNDGLVKLAYRDGVTVTLKGPCSYQVDGPGEGTLYAGQLVANVSPGAIGFKVETPALTVTDLGTEFAINVDHSDHALVDVLTGRVSVAALDSGQPPTELTAGQSLTCDGAAWSVSNTRQQRRTKLLSLLREVGIQRITRVAVADFSSELTGRFDRRAIHLIDGSGLTPQGHSPFPDASVPGGTEGAMWLSRGTLQAPHDPLPAHVTFDLRAAHELTGIHVWNYNEHLRGLHSRGARDVQISVSPTSDSSDLIPLTTSAGDFVFPQATGRPDYSGFAVGLDEVTNSHLLENVRLVRITILSTHGSNPQEDDENLAGAK